MKSDNEQAVKKPGFVKSFVCGIAFTVILVVIVPYVCSEYVHPFMEQQVGNATFAWLSSSMIVTILMWVVMLSFMVVFGGGGIFKCFGVVGVLGLLAGYYILGRIEDAVIPVGTLIITLCLMSIHKKKKQEKESGQS